MVRRRNVPGSHQGRRPGRRRRRAPGRHPGRDLCDRRPVGLGLVLGLVLGVRRALRPAVAVVLSLVDALGLRAVVVDVVRRVGDSGAGRQRSVARGRRHRPCRDRANSSTPLVAGVAAALVLVGGGTVLALRRRRTPYSH
ncbi:LAETG motif-containing sortase-dependent surface protein [Streptomyces rishiriensis]|uniref:LAETG motif-containing sortase-dependent surface protein n=1 Tax=Streptomyces rishiriensis TaxID=68264 RepID=UPI0037D5C6A2